MGLWSALFGESDEEEQREGDGEWHEERGPFGQVTRWRRICDDHEWGDPGEDYRQVSRGIDDRERTVTPRNVSEAAFEVPDEAWPTTPGDESFKVFYIDATTERCTKEACIAQRVRFNHMTEYNVTKDRKLRHDIDETVVHEPAPDYNSGLPRLG